MTSRFNGMDEAPSDPIFGIKNKFLSDLRENRLDLTAGVYRDSTGATPVMEAVSLAQESIVSEEQTKDYLPIAGDASFCESVGSLVLSNQPADSWFHTPSSLLGIADGNGMFHVASINPAQAARLRTEHAIYVLDSGRLNIAAIIEDSIERVIEAFRGVETE